MHISDECLSIFGISYLLPRNSVYLERLNDAILQLHQNGLILKIRREINWEVQKQQTGGLLKTTGSKKFEADAEERGLTLADTEGMFLLMGIGYLLAGSVLVSEIVGGCANKCREIAKRRFSFVSVSRRPSESVGTSNVSRKNSDAALDEQTESDEIASGLRFRRRRSEQLTHKSGYRNVLDKHRRHRSLVSIGEGVVSGSEMQPKRVPIINGVVVKKSTFLKFDEENQLDIKDSAKSVKSVLHHQVEINRVPTPYNFDDQFGEKVYRE